MELNRRGAILAILGQIVGTRSILAATNPTFPSITADDLNKREIKLPAGLEGEWNLLLIGFQREQQNDIDTWLPRLPPLVAKHPKLAYYEISVLSRTNFMLRWVVNTGMRNGIPDKQQRARTITLYLDKKPFREALQIPSEEEISVLLVNKAGEVVWRVDGTASSEKLDSLEACLHGL